jgi:Methyltransferase domain
MRLDANLKRKVPPRVRGWMKGAYAKLRQAGYRYFCPVCQKKVEAFVSLPSFYADQWKLHGSDLRLEDWETCHWNAYSCPNCGASDRDRLYSLYLSRRLNGNCDSSFRLLDIAPAAPLSGYIRRNFQITYRTADLYMENVDDRVDVTCMDCYPDKSFDAIICSHVLEHIPDDQKAISELYRILKPGGWGIVMVPISLRLTEIREDASKITEAQRWQYFGQGDHVRVYTRSGFLSRLHQAGFCVLELENGFFGASVLIRRGIAESSVLYIIEKR